MTRQPLHESSIAYRVAFRILAALFAISAIFHIAAIARPSIDPSAPTWRHALFLFLNLASVVGFLLRPLAFVFLFAALVVQQIYSHGSAAWHAWRDAGKIDFASLGVLIVMPIALALLIMDARRE